MVSIEVRARGERRLATFPLYGSVESVRVPGYRQERERANGGL